VVQKILLILTWWKTFFGWYTHLDNIVEYKKTLSENIFACIEMCRLQYIDIIVMPVKRFYDLLKWKTTLEEEKRKLIKEGSKK